MADNFQSSKVTANEQSSSTKFNNFVQAVEDAVNSLDNSNVAAAAAVVVSKLAAGSNNDVLTTVAGVPTWQPPAATSLPPGMIAPYSGASAPSGWLLCDGSAVSRTTYAALFAITGAVYGAGDGSTTFNLPDLRGRLPVGKGTNAAVDTLGENDGVAEANRRPQHRHTAHSHTVPLNASAVGGSNIQGPANTNATTTTSSVDGGSGNANDSLDAPAHIVLNYIVKT